MSFETPPPTITAHITPPEPSKCIKLAELTSIPRFKVIQKARREVEDMVKSKNKGQQAIQRLEADCAAYGVTHLIASNGRRRFGIACGKCDRTENSALNPNIDTADQVLAHFRMRGWHLDHNTVPYCSTHKQERVIQMDKPVAIEPNPVILVKVITLLNENFDKDKHTYREGWSDERISKEADTAVSFVINYRRKGGYGEIAEDPVITALRRELQALADRHKADEDVHLQRGIEIEEFRKRLDRHTATHHKAQG